MHWITLQIKICHFQKANLGQFKHDSNVENTNGTTGGEKIDFLERNIFRD